MRIIENGERHLLPFIFHCKQLLIQRVYTSSINISFIVIFTSISCSCKTNNDQAPIINDTEDQINLRSVDRVKIIERDNEILEARDNIFNYASYGSLDGINKCLRHNVNVNCQDCNGWTALHWAAVKFKFEAIDLLLAKGADPLIEDKFGQTPLHVISAINGKVQANFTKIEKSIRMLIAKMPDINMRDASGCTPLHIASFYCNYYTVKILLENRADKSIRDENGKTPLELAHENDTVHYRNGMVLTISLRAGFSENVIKLLYR